MLVIYGVKSLMFLRGTGWLIYCSHDPFVMDLYRCLKQLMLLIIRTLPVQMFPLLVIISFEMS